VVKAVKKAQGSKVPNQPLVDKATSAFVHAVFAAAVFTVDGWFFFGPQPALTAQLRGCAHNRLSPADLLQLHTKRFRICEP